MTIKREAEKHILVVDDERINRKTLHMMLKKVDQIQVTEAQGGWDALDKSLAQSPDLILMDIMMPDMDGLEACRRIKQQKETSDIPIIFLSALNDIETKNKGFAAGGIDYVSKPFDIKELTSRVLAHLALKEQADLLQGRSSRLEGEVRRRTQELEASKEELRSNYAYLESINEVLYLSLQDLSLKEILDQTLDAVLNNSNFAAQECGWFFLYNEAHARFDLVSSRNPNNHPEPSCTLLSDNTCTCTLDKDYAEINMSNGSDHAQKRCVQSPSGTCYVPFFFEGQILGLLVVRLLPGHALTPAEHNFLISISRTLAGIVVRKMSAQALQESEDFYRAIFETTQNATCIIREDGYLELVNSAFSALSHLPKENIEGKMVWTEFVHAQDQKMMGMYRKLRAANPKSAPSSYEFRFVNSQGKVKLVTSSVDQIPGSLKTVVSLLDITEQKHFEAELERRAFYDPLTGLPNRALFRTIVDRLLRPNNSHASPPFALLFLDLDRFSLLNESLGHQAGDALLKLVAQRLRETVGSKNTVCRFNSDEFLILLENIHNYSEVVVQCEKIQNQLNKPYTLTNQEVYTTCCIGIVMHSRTEGSPCADDIIRNAGMAMHRAKQEGINGIKAFNPVMHEQTTKFLQIERELHQALKNDEFIVYYQPIIDLPKMTLQGFEGLIRWKHPRRGLITPDEFIPIAEEVDLIIPIGKKVLDTACTQIAYWLQFWQSNDLFVSINLSARQFQQQALVESISQAMHRAQISAKHLKLEITESVIMSDVQTSNTILRQLKNMGLQLAIDDFGTGYSSLSYLQIFPIDYIKIDRSFIWGMDKGGQYVELIKAIVAMGHSMEHKLIAEGIESSGHVNMLRDIGCDFGQGFYFSKPIPADKVSGYISSFSKEHRHQET